MKILGLDNKIYSWNPVLSSNDFNANTDYGSTYHIKARELLKVIFPFESVLEEVTLPGSSTKINDSLRVDFFIQKRKIGIEVHGEQHYSFNKHFFGSEKNYKLALLRDKNKLEWFNRNNLRLIILPFDKVESWKEILLS